MSFEYVGATSATVIVGWAMALVLLGVLAWTVLRLKVPAPSVTEAQAVKAVARAGKRK